MKSNFILKYIAVEMILFLSLVGLLFSCQTNNDNDNSKEVAGAAVVLSQPTNRTNLHSE
ncbi:MAG: hypothetical protein H7A23_18760 [Leptospiraceae bacterium]|nr:hypothetical protein [Leptospiraceae bacterium]MCP5496594.1 hypothetical protein [Leptospiraceae bacterium]